MRSLRPSPRAILLRAACCGLALASVAGAQKTLDLQRPEVLEPEATGFEPLVVDGAIAALQRGPQRLVFSRPVARWEAGALADGRWLILAGGVERALDLYVFDPRDGSAGLPFGTSGGLRMPAMFNEGLGSWPLVETPHLFLFVVEQGEGCRFHAVDFSRGVPRSLAQQDLAPDVRGFDVQFDADSQRVAVGFTGDPARVEFAHPLAPLPVVTPQSVEFGQLQAGASAEREISLHNAGRRPLHWRVGCDGAAFSLDAPGEAVDRVLQPGARAMLRVRFMPLGLGVQSGVVRVYTAVAPGGVVSIAIRGESVLAVVGRDGEGSREPGVGPDPTETAPDRGGDPLTDPPAAVPDPRPPSLRALTTDDLGAVTTVRLDARRVWIGGRLALDPATYPRALWTNQSVECVVENVATGRRWVRPITQAGQLGLAVRAFAGELLRIGLRDVRTEPELLDLVRVAPRLVVDDDELVVLAAPGTRYWLQAFTKTEPERVVATWSGDTDTTGAARIPRAALPQFEVEVWWRVVESGRGAGVLVESAAVRLD